MPSPAHRYALPILLLGAAAIAFAPIFVRLSDIGPVAVGFWRLTLALPVLWALSRRGEAGRNTAPRTPRDFMLLIATGLAFATELTLWHYSIRYTTVANSTLLANAAPVFVALMGWLFLGQRFTPTFLAGLAAAVAGAAILMGDSFALSADRALGDMLATICAMFYAGYLLLVSIARKRFSTGTVMVWSGVVSALVLLPAALLSEPTLFPADLAGWGILLALAWISHAGGQSLIANALAGLPAAMGAVGLLLQPALAAVLAWVVFGEAMGPLQGAGAVIILLGIVLARIGTAR
jgi:drug/metabolite transporter (DMT)-like permease